MMQITPIRPLTGNVPRGIARAGDGLIKRRRWPSSISPTRRVSCAGQPRAALARGRDRAGLRVRPRADSELRPTTISRAPPSRSCSCTCRRPGSSMMGWGVMSLAALGTLVWRHPLADVAGKAAAPIGAAFTLHLPGHRLALGPPDLGHLLGVGRAAHLGAGAVPALSRRARAVLDGRRPGPRLARRGDSHAGRRRSTFRSSSSRSTGGTRCTSRPRCSAWAARPSIRQSWPRCW